jgi:hypothetical protein
MTEAGRYVEVIRNELEDKEILKIGLNIGSINQITKCTA